MVSQESKFMQQKWLLRHTFFYVDAASQNECFNNNINSILFLLCVGDDLLVLSLKELKEKMLSPTMTVKIMPMLLINGGLPSSSKTTALKKLLEKIGSLKLDSKEKDGIAFCYMLAAQNLYENKIVYVPRRRDKGYPTVMYAGVERMIRLSFGKQLKDITFLPKKSSQFSSPDLNEHFLFVIRNLWDEIKRAKQCREFSEWDQSHTCGMALINIWDIGLNKVPNYVLTLLAGHLYNSHIWMFLDLLRDADHLYEVPDIPDNQYDKLRNDKELIMRWRSRIQYFLHFAKLASIKTKSHVSRHNVCDIIASYTGPKEIKDHKSKLKEAVDTVSKQLKLQDLIDTENIETFDNADIEPLYNLFTKIIRAGLDTIDVPLSFIFLRSLFFEKDQLHIKKTS